MYYLIYVSSATEKMSDAAVQQLLETARNNNRQRNITGMLLYKGGNFMQMLEGDRDEVEALFDRIKQDPRHKDVLTIMSGEIEQRNFDDWSMGYCNMDKLGDYPNYADYIRESLLSRHFQQDSHQAFRFIVSFNEWMRE